MSKLVPIKISRYEKTRGEKFVNPDGKFPYFSDLASEALRVYNDKLEEEAKKK